ncbi:3-deoxy-7-phosphoheptulonate synthase [Sphingomonas rhizophila]|uniref:Phospho-2-dehydro-3-deoxyheptonate aldolase n=1 Tax=Sphingomonas rhizophila TaxID=2071607 RepID=A0A7G9SA49_9SPHN|nr:3-deoxy-7-phosphoheptulonate synthase [Sphingomonas rhizophila]QNN64724.1 3-deoxy-7-phosphoheptulonate synthase [Sphingomonas rhizophila]
MNKQTPIPIIGTDADELSALRQDIDRIDDLILELLGERAAVAARIGAVKRQGPSSLPVRPQREADILRRLSSRHILPSLDIGHIWRAILNSSAQIQRPHSLVLWAPPEARLALLDLATRVYGVGITRHWAESRAQAVAEARAGQAIALVAWTGELDTPIDGLDLIGQHELGDPASPWAAALGIVVERDQLPSPQDNWAPISWQSRPHCQIPAYHSPALMAEVEARLSAADPVVNVESIVALKRSVAEAQRGERLILQAGDCAEPIDASLDDVQAMANLILRCADHLQEATGKPVIRIGRMAGQYAKPRSTMVEEIDGLLLPAYRGDAVNGHTASWGQRKPDPRRLEVALKQSRRVAGWVAEQAAPLHVSHEALLLPYETALTRHDPATGRWWNRSAHTVWLGERTRQIGGAHVEYLRGIANPIGIKCGPSMNGDHLIALLDALNPQREEGRIMLVVRSGAGKSATAMPPLVEAVASSGHPVAWLVDPMHGNGRTVDAAKVRLMDDMLAEIAAAAGVLRAAGAHLAGIHLEVTPQDVEECVDTLADASGPRRFTSMCDPRLNPAQMYRAVDAMAREIVR